MNFTYRFPWTRPLPLLGNMTSTATHWLMTKSKWFNEEHTWFPCHGEIVIGLRVKKLYPRGYSGLMNERVTMAYVFRRSEDVYGDPI